jgi:UDP-N-acetylglucosamine 2-epimerase (non-hydrolysing)
LLHEGIDERQISVTGNSVIDALKYVAAQDEPEEVGDLLERLGVKRVENRGAEGRKAESRGMERRGLAGRRLVLVTAHRRENFGQPMENIFLALKELAQREDVEIVYPVHLNPNVQEPANQILKHVQRITLLPPLDYRPMVHLMKHATLILTDSGGLQEEAPSFGIPVLVMRETTERPEGVDAGTLKLVGTEARRIVQEATRLLDDPAEYAKMAKASNPYGDGHTAERIVEALLRVSSNN